MSSAPSASALPSLPADVVGKVRNFATPLEEANAFFVCAVEGRGSGDSCMRQVIIIRRSKADEAIKMGAWIGELHDTILDRTGVLRESHSLLRIKSKGTAQGCCVAYSRLPQGMTFNAGITGTALNSEDRSKAVDWIRFTDPSIRNLDHSHFNFLKDSRYITYSTTYQPEQTFEGTIEKAVGLFFDMFA